MTETAMDPSYEWVVFPDRLDTEPSRDLIGGKAWSLWQMHSLELPVPPAFVVTTRACGAYFEGDALPAGLSDDLEAGIRRIEERLGRSFGGTERPLLVSVRSGAPVSMPGMMDTILDLGMNGAVEAALAKQTGDASFAAEVHRRFCAFYGRLVLGCTQDLDELGSVEEIQNALRDDVGVVVPADPWEQLHGAVCAVFRSSRSRRAIAYKKHYGIPAGTGTAVTVQAMVFGNLDDDSGTGVLFTRNPLDGSPETYGEFLPRAQGEDVVSGRVTPKRLDYLRETHPDVHSELLRAASCLEQAGRDAQDVEFTVEAGQLYLLQSRSAKRTAAAAVRIAVDLVDEGLIEPADAVRRLSAEQVRAVLRPTLDPSVAEAAQVLATGLAASPGVACGPVVNDPDEAQRRASEGVVLARSSTSPDDVHGMIAARAVITERGGSTSHAAVVGRALDLPCVVGCGDGVVDRLTGRTVTVDGGSGRVYDGLLPVVHPDETDDPSLRRLAAWADELTHIRVLADGASVSGPVIDLDAQSVVDEDGSPRVTLPDGVEAVCGTVLASPATVRAAVKAGARVLVVPQRLPALLAVLEHEAAEATS